MTFSIENQICVNWRTWNEECPINVVGPKSLFEGKVGDLDLCEVAKVNVTRSHWLALSWNNIPGF